MTIGNSRIQDDLERTIKQMHMLLVFSTLEFLILIVNLIIIFAIMMK